MDRLRSIDVVMTDHRLTFGARVLYSRLLWHASASDVRTVDIGQTAIAGELKICIRQAQRLLRELIRLGYIEQERTGKAEKTIYHVAWVTEIPR